DFGNHAGKDGQVRLPFFKRVVIHAHRDGEIMHALLRDELLNEALFFGIDHAREAVARWTHIYNTERPHSALGYQAPAVFAAQLNAMGDQLRATELLRRSPIAPSAQPRQIQQRTLGSAG